MISCSDMPTKMNAISFFLSFGRDPSGSNRLWIIAAGKSNHLLLSFLLKFQVTQKSIDNRQACKDCKDDPFQNRRSLQSQRTLSIEIHKQGLESMGQNHKVPTNGQDSGKAFGRAHRWKHNRMHLRNILNQTGYSVDSQDKRQVSDKDAHNDNG